MHTLSSHWDEGILLWNKLVSQQITFHVHNVNQKIICTFWDLCWAAVLENGVLAFLRDDIHRKQLHAYFQPKMQFVYYAHEELCPPDIKELVGKVWLKEHVFNLIKIFLPYVIKLIFYINQYSKFQFLDKFLKMQPSLFDKIKLVSMQPDPHG